MRQKEELSKILRGVKGQCLVYLGSSDESFALEDTQVAHKIFLSALSVSCAPSCQLIVGDLTKFPFENESVDVVVIANLLHNYPEYDKLLSEVARVLAINGKLIITELSLRAWFWERICCKDVRSAVGVILVLQIKNWLRSHSFILKKEKNFNSKNNWWRKLLFKYCFFDAYILLAEKRIIPMTLKTTKIWDSNIIYPDQEPMPAATRNLETDPL